MTKMNDCRNCKYGEEYPPPSKCWECEFCNEESMINNWKPREVDNKK